MKKILMSLIGLIVIAGIALFLLIGNLDKIIKGSLEGIGSELLGVPVTVSSLKLDLKSGTGQISGLYIANPPGYQAKNAFQMDMIRLGLDLGSLGRQPLVINDLNISSPIVELEAREDGSSNLKTLLDNIEKNRNQADRKATEQQPEVEGVEKGEPIRISFKKLVITGVNVNVVIPGQNPVKTVIPDIVKANVGGDTGITPAEVGAVIVGDIIDKSLRASLKKKLTDKVEEATKGLLNDIINKLSSGKGN